MSTCNWTAYDVIGTKGCLGCGGGVRGRVLRTMGTVSGAVLRIGGRSIAGVSNHSCVTGIQNVGMKNGFAL